MLLDHEIGVLGALTMRPHPSFSEAIQAQEPNFW